MSKTKIDRNKRIVEMYDDQTKKLGFKAIGNMFQISESRTARIYRREKAKDCFKNIN